MFGTNKYTDKSIETVSFYKNQTIVVIVNNNMCIMFIMGVGKRVTMLARNCYVGVASQLHY